MSDRGGPAWGELRERNMNENHESDSPMKSVDRSATQLSMDDLNDAIGELDSVAMLLFRQLSPVTAPDMPTLKSEDATERMTLENVSPLRSQIIVNTAKLRDITRAVRDRIETLEV